MFLLYVSHNVVFRSPNVATGSLAYGSVGGLIIHVQCSVKSGRFRFQCGGVDD